MDILYINAELGAKVNHNFEDREVAELCGKRGASRSLDDGKGLPRLHADMLRRSRSSCE
ncbi:hypothetical protein [Roseicyclus sp.]|uniref:hypothetical protein n=1 Tax=Roseicyclus sp. TaxID=1914329 RepID=UPI001BD0B79D|nr:hypothetical protein [Roseicyclus sp.]